MLTPDATYIAERLAALQRRARLIRFVEGFSAALVLIAGVLRLTGAVLSTAELLAAIGCGLLSLWFRSPDRRELAQKLEQRSPDSKNVIVTAEELLRIGAPLPPPAVMAAIVSSARRRIEGIGAPAVFPAGAAFAQLGAACVIVVGAMMYGRVTSDRGVALHAAGSSIIAVRVIPPAYLGRQTVSLTDPTRLSVMRGSTLALSVALPGDSLELRTGSTSRWIRRNAGERLTAQVVADSDGFILLQAHAGPPGSRSRLIPITVGIDSAPRIALGQPGRDLLFPNGRQSLSISLKATDDIALKTVALRFTRVSGSGERFTFTEGEVPLSVTRRSSREWDATALWDLKPLKLEPGDMVVYRAVATDGRPGSPPVESDAFIAEVASPGGVAAAGFALDPEQERYALSEQMVILKTERLLAARTSMAVDAFADAAAEIAVEQRRVRAEFVFMMGGEMEDAPSPDEASMTDLNEEAEAAGEDDLAAGRMVNRGRVALLSAIRNMSKAAGALTAVDVAAALAFEKSALKQLEAAFSHSRIILRALADHERLDPTRRLGGSLSDARSFVHEAVVPAYSAEVRGAIALVRDVSKLPAGRAARSDALMKLAERALQIGPSNPLLRQTADQWTHAAERVSAGNAVGAQQSIDDGALALQKLIRQGTAISSNGASGHVAALLGALRDASTGIRGSVRP